MGAGWIPVAAAVVLAATDAAAQVRDAAPDARDGARQALSASDAAGQSLAGYVPIDAGQRLDWIVEGTIGLRSLAVGVASAGLQTAWDLPPEWERSWRGAAKRYAAREADVALSNTIEGGLGAIWGEDPRYIRAPHGPIRSRIKYAMKTVVLAPRRDGNLRPAWARYAGNVVNNLLENAWLPARATTPAQTAIRSVSGLASRLGGNLFEEFWPDIKARLTRR